MDRKEQIKQAKRLIDTGISKDLVEVLKNQFPELRESEDERIRKEIKDIVLSYRSNCVYEGTHHFDECLDYLEKQKEHLPVPDKFSGLKSLMLQYLQSAANRKDDTEIESDTDLFGRKILDYVWKYSDEQKEQKPAEWGENERIRKEIDERTRKEIIDFVNHYRHNTDLTTEQAVWCKKVIAYLERQKVNTAEDFVREYDCNCEKFCMLLRKIAAECDMTSIDWNKIGVIKLYFDDGSSIGTLRAFKEAGLINEK